MLSLSCKPTELASSTTVFAVTMVPCILSVNELALWTRTALSVEPTAITRVSEKAVHVHG